jgi:peptidoglycan/xylan/chitin deacetylase (PgdA/CDA1 family)
MTVRERSSAAALAMLIGAHAVPALAAKSRPLASALGVMLDDPAAAGAVLTFDDGPHPYATPAMLDTLDAAGVRATFFLVGEQVARHPSAAAEIAARGHAIGVHCQRHRNLLRLGPRQTVRDIARAEQEIVAATGVVPRVYRPPYGILNGTALAYARRRGWATMLWSAWGRDWRAAESGETIARRVNGGLRPGAVVLLHDADYYGAFGCWRNTLDAVPRVVARARELELDFALPSVLV